MATTRAAPSTKAGTYTSGSQTPLPRRDAPQRSLREHQREMQQQRRQRRHRNRVTPVEDPVQPVERAVERKRERAEERDAQPEEMERRLVGRPPQANRGADEKREQADGRQHEVHRPRRGERRERDRQRLSLTQSDNRIGERRPGVARVLIGDDVSGPFDRGAVDGDQHVARQRCRPGPRPSRWRPQSPSPLRAGRSTAPRLPPRAAAAAWRYWPVPAR